MVFALFLFRQNVFFVKHAVVHAVVCYVLAVLAK